MLLLLMEATREYDDDLANGLITEDDVRVIKEDPVYYHYYYGDDGEDFA